jgi:sugar phosphate isomerase/epimerase
MTIAARQVVLAYQTIAGVTAPQTVEVAAAAGFKAVTIRVVPDGGSTDAAVIAGMAMSDATSATSRATGVEVADVECVVLTPDWTPEAAKPVVEVGAAESLAQLCNMAAEAGMFPSLEFMPASEAKTIEDAERIVALSGHSAATVTVDALHLVRSGGTVEDVAAVLERGKVTIACLHLCDAPSSGPATLDELVEEVMLGRLLPGDGALPLQDLVDLLPGADLYIETPVRALADDSAADRARAAAASLHNLRPDSVAQTGPAGA